MNHPEYQTWAFHNLTEQSVRDIISQTKIPQTVIEIGVFQGYFTFAMTHMIAPHDPHYRHYAIDPYADSQELDNTDITQAGDIFRNNLLISPLKQHIEFLHMPSNLGLLELWKRNIQADFIYIDGDHRASGVLQDLVLSWQVLKIGGVILCDDAHDWIYTNPQGESAVQYSPRMAIDGFLHCNWHKVKHLKLSNSSQAAFVKLQD